MKATMLLRKGLLAATAAGGLVLFAGAASATQIHFTPEPGGSTDNIYEAATPNPPDTSLTSGVNLTRMNWRAVNNDAATPTWAIRFDAAGNFEEKFTFILLTTQVGIFSPTNVVNFGDDNGAPFVETYVTMEATLSGTALPGNDLSDGNPLLLNYTSANFEMFYHSDGITDNGVGNDDGSGGDLIARFSGTGTTDDSGTNSKATLSWKATLDEAAAGIFSIGGNDVTSGPADAQGMRAADQALVLAFTEQVVQVGVASPDGTCCAATPGGPVATANQLIVGLDTGGTTDFKVPEPGTLGLLGIGLMGIGVAVRRRRRAA